MEDNSSSTQGISSRKRSKTDNSNKNPKKAKTLLDEVANKYAEFECPSTKMEVDEGDEEEEEENVISDFPVIQSSKQKLVDDFIEELLKDVESNATRVAHKTLSIEQCETEVRNQPKNASKWIQYMLLLLRAVQLDRMRVVFERAMTELGRNPGSDSDTARGKVLFVAISVEAGLLNAINLESALSKMFFHGAESSASRGQLEQNQLDRVTVMVDKLQAFGQLGTVRAVCDRLSDLCLFELAEQIAKSLVKGNKAQEPVDWLNLVKVRLRAGKTTEAREAEANAARLLRLALIPSFVCSVSQLELKFGDMERALKLLQEQIAAHPQRKDVHLAYVKALVECQRTREAKLASDKALSLVKNMKKEELDKILSIKSK
ncbi:Protein RRP5 [Cichlidogyrus casuarinus]|uniref:Protein RRP5 n=1 Tax=Cichlidogyrus casuarinus TaxID=1844966 RepID=A0ABD2PTZ6_9PLAT